MDKPSCLKCDNPETMFSFSFSNDCLAFMQDGSVIIYFYCTKCDTEFQVIYRPDKKSIVSEN